MQFNCPESQIGQEFYWRKGVPVGWIFNGIVTLFPKKITDYKGYLRDQIMQKEIELEDLKKELKDNT